MTDPELQAVRKDYQVFTAIEQQLRDALESSKRRDNGIVHESLDTVLQVIQQHKADLFAKYNI